MTNLPTNHNFDAGLVPAHQHVNGGGWVADTATVSTSAYVGPNATVSDSAQVSGNARVFSNARVPGFTQVYEPTAADMEEYEDYLSAIKNSG